MNLETPKQAFATREAHEALIELKKLVDEAAKITHQAEIESFHAAIIRDRDSTYRRSLPYFVLRVKSPELDTAKLMVRENI